MVRRFAIVASILASACSAGGGGDVASTDSGLVTDARADSAGDAGDETSGCLFGCDVPAPKCSDACTSVVQTVASCENAVCKYDSKTTTCPTGCNASTGQCDESACAKVACGDKSTCGGTCSDNKVCCTKSTYDRTTGLVSGSAKACCDDGDTLTSVDDACATGSNHGADPVGNCVNAWEGAGNGGSACGTAHCLKLVCP